MIDTKLKDERSMKWINITYRSVYNHCSLGFSYTFCSYVSVFGPSLHIASIVEPPADA